jgi:pyruvate,water dikinase
MADGARVPPGVVLAAGSGLTAPDERASLLREAVDALGAGPFAVRSSGITEDGADRSFAGMYETVLDVDAADVVGAAERVLASARDARVAAYEPGAARNPIAVLVQAMVRPAASGVALTADPIGGDRGTTVVTAVRGVGERLVSGEAMGDEWSIVAGTATARRRPERAIDRTQALAVATEARRIADRRGAPQDVEWAIDEDGVLWILQARPMTALPPEVSWDPQAPGGFTRQLRFGEWISEPVTPLFESWLLSRMEERLHARIFEEIGQRAPLPHHVVVNGWYFYSLNWMSPRAFFRNLPRLIWHAIRTPRHVAGIIPPTVRFSIPLLERQWREQVLPAYRQAVADAEARVETAPVSELPALIDELADQAGEYFFSVAALAGAAYKLEINLAGFYKHHLAPTLGGTHLPLVAGFEADAAPDPHAVTTLDWWQPPTAIGSGPARVDHGRVVAARLAAEAAAFEALAANPRRLAAFKRVLADAQRMVPLREEHVRELTLAWPAMRRAVLRIGEALVANGTIAVSDDVFFLTRDEATTGLADSSRLRLVDEAPARRRTREEQATLVPPLFVGHLHPMMKRLIDSFATMLGAVRSDTAIVSGTPASPGRAAGRVRVIRGPEAFDELEPGEVLVAPITAPAWTPLFGRAAAVVTDVGSAAAHASIIAREYGIPAVVGCGDATTRLRTGMRVLVDGGTGNVEPELAQESPA